MEVKFADVSYSLLDIYDEYIKEVPAQMQKSREIFLKVNNLFVQKAVDKILLDSEIVKFPVIGNFRIKKFKQDYNSRLYVDHKKTKDTGIKTYHINEDREGYIYKWHWTKLRRHKYMGFYSFIPARYSVRRKLPKMLKNHPEIDYFT